jgi:hypothetical protein
VAAVTATLAWSVTVNLLMAVPAEYAFGIALLSVMIPVPMAIDDIDLRVSDPIRTVSPSASVAAVVDAVATAVVVALSVAVEAPAVIVTVAAFAV